VGVNTFLQKIIDPPNWLTQASVCGKLFGMTSIKKLFEFLARIMRRPADHRRRDAHARDQAARIKAELAAEAPDSDPRKIVLPSPIRTDEERDPPVRCPECGSAQVTANPDGFNTGAALVGAAVAGPIGLMLGSGYGKVTITCLKCGTKFRPGSD